MSSGGEMRTAVKGIAFDIDGVFLRGGKVLDRAIDALRLVRQNSIPHIFITNGGGQSEVMKASTLSEKLKCAIESDIVLQCHTPYRDLVGIYNSERILVLGHENCLEVAKSYGE